jgi:hypothetical protein
MATHWPRIQEALKTLRRVHSDAAVGLQLFWAEVTESAETGMAKNNWCGLTYNKVLDVGAHPEQELVTFLGDTPPGPAFIGGLFETSSVVEPLNYYLKNASKLADPTRTNYLVFITSGNDNCFGSVFATKAEKLLAYQKLAIELGKLNIRVVPVGFDAANMPNSDGLNGTTKPNTDLDVLGTLLAYGGTGLKEVPKVDDPQKLSQVIEQVGKQVRNCRFEIPATLDPTAAVNPFQLDFTVNSQVVARDRRNLSGWNFVNGNTSQVELFGPACDAVRSGQPLVAQKSCSQDVCGTAAVSVETRPRAVLMLLDASASRIECVDGSLDCLVLPTSGAPRTQAFWEVVEHAVSESLTAPINDDIEFGLQFFPGKAAASFTCDVATAPEIAPAQGTEISIMSQMLEKLPLGLSPVVQVLENVAAAPGRLADPGVLGSVVLLSDGGDNCLGQTQDVLVTRLGAAAKKLLDAGVKTYVVRFGSTAGQTPEQDAQLRAIAANGGAALPNIGDPTRPPYLDAKNQAEFVQALAAISDQLATCSFSIAGLSEDADKDRANLYLNGEVIPFDSAATKQAGWNWIYPEKTSIELYGDSCKAFKTNRRTSVLVEFGCVPVILQ